MVSRGTGERRALAWHHKLEVLMLGASCGIEITEIVHTKQRNPEETEDVMASGSSKDVSHSGVTMESVRIESKPCSKSATAWSRRNNNYTLVLGESGLVMTPYL